MTEPTGNKSQDQAMIKTRTQLLGSETKEKVQVQLYQWTVKQKQKTQRSYQTIKKKS